MLAKPKNLAYSGQDTQIVTTALRQAHQSDVATEQPPPNNDNVCDSADISANLIHVAQISNGMRF